MFIKNVIQHIVNNSKLQGDLKKDPSVLIVLMIDMLYKKFICIYEINFKKVSFLEKYCINLIYSKVLYLYTKDIS